MDAAGMVFAEFAAALQVPAGPSTPNGGELNAEIVGLVGSRLDALPPTDCRGLPPTERTQPNV